MHNNHQSPLIDSLRRHLGPSMAGLKLSVEDVLLTLPNLPDAEFSQMLSIADDDGTPLKTILAATAAAADDMGRRLRELASAIKKREQAISASEPPAPFVSYLEEAIKQADSMRAAFEFGTTAIGNGEPDALLLVKQKGETIKRLAGLASFTFEKLEKAAHRMTEAAEAASHKTDDE